MASRTSQLNGTYIINHAFESLKFVLLAFELNDYKTYSFARKHYRVSRNVTNLQISIGEKLFPISGLRGHGGNNVKGTAGAQVNHVYVNELYKCFNKDWATDSTCQINVANFSTNKRPYDVTKSRPTFSLETNRLSVHPDALHTNFGLSMWHENVVRGMAVYAILLDGINRNYDVIGGVSTVKNTPWNLSIETDATGTDGERECTMQTWCYYDFMIKF